MRTNQASIVFAVKLNIMYTLRRTSSLPPTNAFVLKQHIEGKHVEHCEAIYEIAKERFCPVIFR